MSRIPVSTSLPLALLAGLPSTAGAQQPESTVLRSEQELKISIELPALPNTQCQATSTAAYEQRNTNARVESTIKVEDCKAASGAFTVTLRIRGDDGEVKLLELMETWQRADDQDVSFSADYPIGENVDLVSARVRGLSCTCADPAGED
ncbi:MAG TPA: hypothetical protein VKA43_09700 [Gammaproteobacteria bacterium]|nr:hypothetical protein [Gammaproteobacteria bacterium]